jgi:hypothetical protein
MPSWVGEWTGVINWFDDWFGSGLPPADKTIDTPIERTRFVPSVVYPTALAVAREATVPAVTREITLHEEPPS